LRSLLEREEDVEVVGECGDGPAAVEALRAGRPDLLFLDIQMPELDGFGVLREVRNLQVPAVVFVTAFGQHAVQAFDEEATDYLVKPFDDERFSRALERARSRVRSVRAASGGAPDPGEVDPAVRAGVRRADRPGARGDRPVDRGPGLLRAHPRREGAPPP